MKKILFILSFLLSFQVIGDVGSAKAQTTFPDAEGHWAKDAIYFLNEKEIVNGFPNGSFGVEDTIKRRDAALMIARAKGLDLTKDYPNNPFSDIKSSDYYYKAVVAATEAGYLSGFPGGTFAPDETLTREQMAKIIVEAYNLKNLGGNVFKDVPVNSWSFEYIQTLVSNKISNGFPGQKFSPQKSITRAEFAMMLARAIDERFRDKDFVVEDFANTEEEAAYVIQNYSPTAYYILKNQSQLEGKSIETLIREWKTEGVLYRTINTAVHEITHGYQTSPDWEYDFSKGEWYFRYGHPINNKMYITGQYQSNIFPSKIMGATIPEDLRTFRWDLYVSPNASDIMSSVQSGPYGLLVEFEAYYHGDKAAYDSYGYLLSSEFNSAEWHDYYTSMDGTGFYEFKYFILNYLKYAKVHYPKVYQHVMNDNRFKTAFKYVHNNYEKLVEKQIPARKNQIVQDLENKGIHAKIQGPYLYIDGMGRGVPESPSLIKVKQELQKPEYQQILNELIK